MSIPISQFIPQRVDTCVCITDSFCYTPETNNIGHQLYCSKKKKKITTLIKKKNNAACECENKKKDVPCDHIFSY